MSVRLSTHKCYKHCSVVYAASHQVLILVALFRMCFDYVHGASLACLQVLQRMKASKSQRGSRFLASESQNVSASQHMQAPGSSAALAESAHTLGALRPRLELPRHDLHCLRPGCKRFGELTSRERHCLARRAGGAAVGRVPGAARALKDAGMKELRALFSSCISWAKKLNLASDTHALKCACPPIHTTAALPACPSARPHSPRRVQRALRQAALAHHAAGLLRPR